MFRLRKRCVGRVAAARGSSLIVVVCVSAFLAAFALAMLYTGSMLTARANRRLEQERCYQLAGSFARVLDEELLRYDGPPDSGDPAAAAYEKSFYRFACQFLEDGNYAEYNPDRPENTVFHYRVGKGGSPAGAGYGNVTIILYKENNQETDVLSGILPFNPVTDGGEAVNPVESIMAQISRYTFHIDVTAELDGLAYTYKTSYDPWVKYMDAAVEFTAAGSRIAWDDAGKRWVDMYGNEYMVPEDAAIYYKINPSFGMLKSCTFTKTVSQGEEGGGGGGNP